MRQRRTNVPTTLNVVKADCTLETAFAQPYLAMFRDTPGLLQSLLTHLQAHAPQLQNIKIERGNESVGDFHVVCHLYDFRTGVRVFTEKVSVACVNIQDREIERVGAVVVDALSAVQAHQPAISFGTHTFTVAIHGRLEDGSALQYLSNFSNNVPTGLGPFTGSGSVMYFGPKDDRILSTMTVDLSALVPDGLLVRPYVVWDAKRIELRELPVRGAEFVRHALGAFGLEVSPLRASS
jgi:hypothetical protein